MNTKEEDKTKKEKIILWNTMAFAWELGYTIAVPLVIFALLGRFLDNKYEASPIFLIVGIFFAMIISGILVFRKAKKILEDSIL